jgi:hypothetical protein
MYSICNFYVAIHEYDYAFVLNIITCIIVAALKYLIIMCYMY